MRKFMIIVIVLLSFGLFSGSADVEAQQNLTIVAPSQSRPEYAGRHNAPGKFMIKIKRPQSSFLQKADFTVQVNGATATITTFYGGFHHYFIEVLAPPQATSGSYDLVVTAAQNILTVPNGVHYAASQNVDVVTVLDRSGSMGIVDMEAAKDAAQQFIDAMEEDDKVGVVSFATHATTNFPLTTINADPTAESLVFSDDMENGSTNWTAEGTWALTDLAAYSGSNAWTDSPGGYYQNDTNSSLESIPFSLETVTQPALEFWTIYDIEAGYDFGYVEVTTDGGTTWETLATFTGFQTDWSKKRVFLSDVAGESSVQIRFRLETDETVTGRGWTIDDVMIVDGGISTRDEAINSINNIQAEGLTSIGAGLERGQRQLTNNGDPNHPDAMVLLGDGFENAPPYVSQELPTVINQGTTVHTIGLGNQVDMGLLSGIATETGGTAHYAPTGDQLADIYCTIAAQLSPQQSFTCSTGSVNPSEIINSIYVIKPFVGRISSTLRWQDDTKLLQLSLIDPTGRLITPAVAANDPKIEYISKPKYQRYEVDEPISGNWLVQVEYIGAVPLNNGIVATQNQEAVPYTLIISDQSHLSMNIFSSKGTYDPDEAIEIAVALSDDAPILGAQVEANYYPYQSLTQSAMPTATDVLARADDDSIAQSSGTVDVNTAASTLILTDDDNDGVYTGLIPADQVNPGSYIFDVTASGSVGSNPPSSFTKEGQHIVNVREPTNIFLPIIIK